MSLVSRRPSPPHLKLAPLSTLGTLKPAPSPEPLGTEGVPIPHGALYNGQVYKGSPRDIPLNSLTVDQHTAEGGKGLGPGRGGFFTVMVALVFWYCQPGWPLVT